MTAIINPNQIAYITDDDVVPEAESGPSPFHTDEAKRAGGFQG